MRQKGKCESFDCLQSRRPHHSLGQRTKKIVEKFSSIPVPKAQLQDM